MSLLHGVCNCHKRCDTRPQWVCVRVYNRACVRVHALVPACARACTWICVSLRAFTRINANTVSCMHLRACSHAGLIKTQTRLRAKIRKTQTHFGFWNFQDVLYIHVHVCALPVSLMWSHPLVKTEATSFTALSCLTPKVMARWTD